MFSKCKWGRCWAARGPGHVHATRCGTICRRRGVLDPLSGGRSGLGGWGLGGCTWGCAEVRADEAERESRYSHILKTLFLKPYPHFSSFPSLKRSLSVVLIVFALFGVSIAAVPSGMFRRNRKYAHMRGFDSHRSLHPLRELRSHMHGSNSTFRRRGSR
jgi:hypothetical protein